MKSTEFAVYVPTWLSEASYAELAGELPPGAATRLIVAFAAVTDHGSVEPPLLSDGCIRLIDTLGPDCQLSLAIGGWGASDADHNLLLKNWATATINPEQFATSVEAALRQLSMIFGRSVQGVDIDWEFPAADQSDGLKALVLALRGRLPDCLLTMAVPAGGLAVPVEVIVPLVDSFHVMTYDKVGLWSETSGDIAPPDWTMDSVDHWVAWAGDPAKIFVGYPAYGYVYTGATGPRQKYEQAAGKVILFRDAPDAGSQSAGDGSWMSLVSSQQMCATQAMLFSKYPTLGGVMLWSVAGATPAVFEALSHT